MIPKIIELSTELLSKVELQVVDSSSTPKDRFLLKTQGVFRQSEKETVPKDAPSRDEKGCGLEVVIERQRM